MLNKQGVYIIAEIAQAHDGSLGILHSYIDALAETGVNAVKFQTHIAEAESSMHEPFRVKFSYVDATRFDYWKRMGFTAEQWAGIKQHCEEKGIDFLSSPFSNAAVSLLEDLDVIGYKIGSGEVNNLLLLEQVAATGKPVILSSGMSSFAELDRSMEFLRNKYGESFSSKVAVMQCTTQYPTQAEDIGLNVLAELKARYQLKTGFSDHSGKIYPALAATALGADLLEFHAVFDRRMFGPDAKSSLQIDEIAELVRGVRFIEKSLNNPVNKNDNSRFSELKNIFEKSLSVNKNLKAGHTLQLSDLESKKPKGYGVPAMEYEQVIGKTLRHDKVAFDFLTPDDLQS